MLSSLSARFRPFIWFLIISFVISSTPHIELLFPYTVKLTGSAHAADAAPSEESPGPDAASKDPDGTKDPDKTPDSPLTTTLTVDSGVTSLGLTLPVLDAIPSSGPPSKHPRDERALPRTSLSPTTVRQATDG